MVHFDRTTFSILLIFFQFSFRAQKESIVHNPLLSQHSVTARSPSIAATTRAIVIEAAGCDKQYPPSEPRIALTKSANKSVFKILLTVGTLRRKVEASDAALKIASG